jgi:hypothetical protein
MHTLLKFTLSVLVLLVSVGYIAVWTSITRKTGRNPWVGMIMFIPGVNLVFLVVLAVFEWPIEAELNRCKMELEALRAASPTNGGA